MTPFAIALLLLAGLAAVGLAIGLILGRYVFPARGPRPVRFDISDQALARIAYEARRAYRQSVGVFNLKSWNNLDEAKRERMVSNIASLRRRPGDRCFDFESALIVAITRLGIVPR